MLENNQIVNVESGNLRELFNEAVSITRLTQDTKSISYVFDNQIEVAKDIIYNFYEKKDRWVMLLAEMQAGKSGTFFSVPYIISRNQALINRLGIDMFDNEINVYLLTGMNEKELISQFEVDIQSFTGMNIKKNIIHNSEMNKLLNTDFSLWNNDEKEVISKMRKNCLILIDESHYGSDKNQVLNKFLTQIVGISASNVEKLKENNIYVVSISATPMAEFIASDSNNNKKIIILNNSENYYGIIEMFNLNKVHDSFKIKLYAKTFIDNIININKIGYVVVRCDIKQQELIKQYIIQKNIDFETIDYDRYNKNRMLDNQDINDILKKTPEKITIVFLKGLLRAGKRVNTKNVIMVFDTPVSNVDTTVQSLLGRCCGYNKNKDIEIYCDKTSAEKYKIWVENKFDINFVPDKSKNVSKKTIKKIGFSPSRFINNIIIENVDSNNILVEYLESPRKSDNIKKLLYESINNSSINNILFNYEYVFSSIINITEDSAKTTIRKWYEEPRWLNYPMHDYKKIDEDSVGKIIISGTYHKEKNELIVMFLQIIDDSLDNTINDPINLVNQKTMYI